jgi:uncharacterized protein YjiS (DUF1127 family)
MSAALERIRPNNIFGKVVETVLAWRARARERAELVALDDRMLKDIGLTRSDVYREYHKAFLARLSKDGRSDATWLASRERVLLIGAGVVIGGAAAQIARIRAPAIRRA